MARSRKKLSAATKGRIGAGVAASWAKLKGEARAARIRTMTAWWRK